jgi:tetratricopeptide (TPR) repeat protein
VAAGAVLALAALVAGTAEVAADRRLARAVELDAAGDRLGAIAELDRARSWAPQRWDLWQARARIAERVLVGGSAASGLPDPRRDPAALERFTAAAFADVDRALAAAPDDPDLLADRAALLSAAGRHEEAAAAFRAVLDGPYPNSSRAWLGLGTARAGQGDPSGALDAWEEAAALAPDDVRALTNVAVLHASAGRTEAALAAVEEALERQPDDPVLVGLRDQLRE